MRVGLDLAITARAAFLLTLGMGRERLGARRNRVRLGTPQGLTVTEMTVICRVEADFRAVVQMAVNELGGAGVGLVPSWAGDHVVVAELLLLDVTWVCQRGN